MKIFLDTANVVEIRAAAQLGLVDGVTTNPSLIAKEGTTFKERIKEICSVVSGDVSAETIATDWEGMVREGRELATWAPNVVVKAPCTPDGLRATRVLAEAGIKVNVTLIFSATQGLLACKNGAYIISPFVGRLDDIGLDGMELVRDLVQFCEIYDFPTQVLAASIRTPNHVIAAAKAGAHIATMPASVFNTLYRHPLTDNGMSRFLSDWKTLPAYEEAIFPRQTSAPTAR
ncbi:MAG: fructose-6-phosphate aldolase [Chloroflexi bacterium]|nr:fructose-6-phosphate aldolase [Chloroflexota bacterium]